MCQHQPPCPPADATDRQAAHVVASHPEQGWSLLCNGAVLFEDTGVLLPGGQSIPPHRPAVTTMPAPAGPGCRGAAHGAPGGGMTPVRTRMTASQRREMVLQAALIEFAARGLDGTSTQDIALRAGISQAYLFRLFPTKKTLFVSLVRRCFQQVTQALATAAAGHAGEEALQAMGSAFGQLCQQRTLPLMQLHAYAAANDPEIRAATRAAFGNLRDSVERLTGLPPAQVQQWLGIGMLMTTTTAMNLQAADIPRRGREH